MTAAAYYNEMDPYAAQWLRNLIAAGHIAPGDVDERGILEVKPDDLRRYTQCHFFAGIAGWSYALRLAGWPDDRPVWTGSCPCQPFSAAGKQRGSDDERHLWPAFFGLIRECGPASVFGEQVAGAAGLAWLDHVCADLEGAGYAAAAANLCAAGAGAYHIRQRLYWVADMQGQRRGEGCADTPRGDVGAWPQGAGVRFADDGGSVLGNSKRAFHRCEGQASDHAGPEIIGPADWASRSGGAFDIWDGPEWLQCSDGKARPTQPGLFPLAHGVPGRVGQLRAYGNAIVPQIAAAFVMAADV